MMPDVEVKNETSVPLRIAMIAVSPIHCDNYVEAGQSFNAHVGSFQFTFEARTIENGNEYSVEDSLAKAGLISGAVAAGTASVALSMSGPEAGGISPLLMKGAQSAGEAYGTPAQGVVLQNSRPVGFENLIFSIRTENDQYQLVEA
ncbi:hypothetical protein SERLA73DRAFT_183988 [Serpula lacrymans var. lacrymans S7.3]|uniref:Uncharacterized protein n=2 Tax=Serpula lacrymans var. lacrymans TaxID=341189 RepID=F8Q2A1_SERL3|nr:uncharacterized protein SERLADRAFT_471421 [Serpula lacrymans var. lacrymans S7.9]EGN97312.1 hypothetical protein SERLA73DRAFT_183988 [Serpula lacrymans var. lacrymans S7.3]EGO22899.1 hypothetical protein SERLADRAFT_471421 [Serpula lacrymans var. lacrymans S7.9]